MKNSILFLLVLIALTATTTTTFAEERFIAGECGSVIDHKTGLEWFVGPDQATDWNQAGRWIEHLKECGGRWRWPTLGELKEIYQPNSIAGKGWVYQGIIVEARLSPLFKKIGGGTEVWAVEIKDETNAWLFDFHFGNPKAKPKLYGLRVRAFAVRTSMK